jgi:hypothetical protein
MHVSNRNDHVIALETDHWGPFLDIFWLLEVFATGFGDSESLSLYLAGCLLAKKVPDAYKRQRSKTYSSADGIWAVRLPGFCSDLTPAVVLSLFEETTSPSLSCITKCVSGAESSQSRVRAWTGMMIHRWA